MKTAFYIHFILVFTNLVLVAQNDQWSCGLEFTQKHLEASPAYQAALMAQHERIRHYHELQKTDNQQGNSAAVVREIPVVIHVLHTGQAIGLGASDKALLLFNFNPSDDSIIAWLDYVNKCYSAEAPQKMPGTRGVMPYRFVLAKRGPDCLPTTGINRINVRNNPKVTTYDNYFKDTLSRVSFLNATDVNLTTSEEMIAGLNELRKVIEWPTDRYLNIWIVHHVGKYSIGGFATPPSYVPALNFDGVILKSYIIKTDDRTATHEIGHYLGLFHTFEGSTSNDTLLDNICAPNTDCETQGDFVCDTEPHNINSLFSDPCVTDTTNLINPCTQLPWGDSRYNYMSYNYFGCDDRFTKGQVAFSYATMMTTDRRLLFSSPALSLSGPCINDVGVEDLTEAPSTVPFPNPFHKTLQVYLGKGRHHLRLSTLQGSVVLQADSDQEGPLEFNTEALPPGFYLLSVLSANGRVQHLKLMHD